MKNVAKISLSIFGAWFSMSMQAQQQEPQQTVEKNIIQWVDQYPSTKSTNKSFLKKLDELIFGAEPLLMNRLVCSVMDPYGNLWTMNQGNGGICKFDGRNTQLYNDKKLGPYPSLVSASYIPGEGLLFTDSYLNEVFLISEETDKTTAFLPNDTLNQPTGIAYNSISNEIWIIETAAHRISLYSSSGHFLRSIGSRGRENGNFNFPTHLWIDSLGLVYIVDAMNFRIQLFDSFGNFLSCFGKAGNTTGSMGRPKGIATDSHGNIYVADALFNTIQIFNNKGEFLYYFGSQGSEEHQFWMPSGIYIDEKDYIYVSDTYNNRIQIFQLVRED